MTQQELIETELIVESTRSEFTKLVMQSQRQKSLNKSDDEEDRKELEQLTALQLRVGRPTKWQLYVLSLVSEYNHRMKRLDKLSYKLDDEEAEMNEKRQRIAYLRKRHKAELFPL